MQTFKLTLAAGLCALVAACGSSPDIASRNVPFEVLPPADRVQPVSLPPAQSQLQTNSAIPLSVSAIRISVPKSLRASEANSYYPRGDIVWRGDPIGDRHAQVAAIFDTAFREGTKNLNGATPVMLDVKLVRFHSVSEKARYSVGGVHNIVFDFTVRSATTGEALAPTRKVHTDLPALGGRAAIESDRQGQTQKVRVTNHLQQFIQTELSRFIAG